VLNVIILSAEDDLRRPGGRPLLRSPTDIRR
jgi:hypothetical protein